MAFFGRFTERAQKALIYAQEEARNLGHNYVGTEHLLLGLLREGEGAAAQVLKSLGMDSNKTREQVENLVGKGSFNFTEGFGYTPRTKRVMELSFMRQETWVTIMGHRAPAPVADTGGRGSSCLNPEGLGRPSTGEGTDYKDA